MYEAYLIPSIVLPCFRVTQSSCHFRWREQDPCLIESGATSSTFPIAAHCPAACLSPSLPAARIEQCGRVTLPSLVVSLLSSFRWPVSASCAGNSRWEPAETAAKVDYGDTILTSNPNYTLNFANHQPCAHLVNSSTEAFRRSVSEREAAAVADATPHHIRRWRHSSWNNPTAIIRPSIHPLHSFSQRSGSCVFSRATTVPVGRASLLPIPNDPFRRRDSSSPSASSSGVLLQAFSILITSESCTGTLALGAGTDGGLTLASVAIWIIRLQSRKLENFFCLGHRSLKTPD